MTTLHIVFECGALYEQEGKYGTSHLMEHLICKNFEDYQSILTKNSIAWNAYTGDERVVFHFTGLSSRLDSLKEELVKRILAPISDYVTEEAFLNEKKTVLQEYKDVFMNPSNCKELNLLRKHYDYYAAIGKYSDVENFTYEDAVKTKNMYFSKPVRIVEVGPKSTEFLKDDSLYSEPRKDFRVLKYKQAYKCEFEKEVETDKSEFICFSKKNVSKSDFLNLFIAVSMLTSGLESPFYQEIRVKRGLSYFSRGVIQKNISHGMLTFNSCTTKEKENELRSLYEQFFSDIEKHLTVERFNDIVSALEISIEESSVVQYQHVHDFVRMGCIGIIKKSKLSKVKFEDVVEVAKKYINLDNIVIEC